MLLALADHAHDDGTKCFPGLRYLAWKTGFKRRQAQRVLRSLEQRGIIVPVANVKGGRGGATEYHIFVEKGVKMTPFQRGEAARHSEPPRASFSTVKSVTEDAPTVFIRYEPGGPRSVGCQGLLERAKDTGAISSPGLGEESSTARKLSPGTDANFRKHLEDGIHRRKVDAAYFDVFRATNDESKAIREALNAATASLFNNRGALELRNIDETEVAELSWVRIQPHIGNLAEIVDFRRRRNSVVAKAVGTVADAALELRAVASMGK
jgi:hypothetical protein